MWEMLIIDKSDLESEFTIFDIDLRKLLNFHNIL